MLPQLKPSDTEIEQLALAETDHRQQARFAPLRWGFAGNLLVLMFAGALGLAHAAVTTLWRKIFSPSRHGAR